MWFFSRKYTLKQAKFFEGFKDYHSHILPAVDDGVRTLDESLTLLDYFEGLGVSDVVLTPHVMIGVNDTDELVCGAYDELKGVYAGSINLSLASEYMLDSGFAAHLERGARLIEGDNILVETSYFSAPSELDMMLYDIISEGVTPIIAHAERYLYMPRSKYHSLKELDYKLQLNLLSLSGAYGDRVAQRAIYLLEQGMYDIIGSDIHDLNNFISRIERTELKAKHIDMLLELKSRGLNK